MPGGTTEVGGNTKLQVILGLPALASPASVGANSSVTNTASVPGLLPYDLIDVQLQSHVAGLSVASAWCAAANVMTVQWVNSTAAPITTQSFVAIVGVTRMENANVGPPGQSNFPQAII